jgi:protein SCO1/2
MQGADPIRGVKRWALGWACAIVLVFGAGRAWAQSAPVVQQPDNDIVEDRLPALLSKIGIHQNLNQQIPLDLPFTDETGKAVKLGDYFGHRPVILALVYYRCPLLCSEELSGLVSALEMVKFNPGRDFDVVVASIDPSEGPDVARPEKVSYLKRYGRPETADGWHFLTGPESSIAALTQAVGFGYVRVPGPDGKLTQFAHSSGLEIITPEGRISQYYMGVEYSPVDLRTGLIEASHHRIGTWVDNIMTYCYHYEAVNDRRSMVIARIVQLACAVTFFWLGSFLVVNFRRDFKEAAEIRTGSTRAYKG